MMDYIQFIGTQRSGSNLLRLMLNQHSQISAHHPPHLLRTFVPLLPCYGDLSIESNRKVLVDDMVEWVLKNPVPWNINAIDKEILIQQSTGIADVFVGIYQTMMRNDKASIFCCKSTFNVFYKELLEEKYTPFYIYLYRDGRDVAASFKKAIVGPKHIYSIANKWHAEQQKSLSIVRDLDESRYIKLSYEELISDPQEVLNSICRKVGVDFEKKMLQYHRSDESKLTAESGEMWKNVSRPIIKSNQNKFRSELTEDEIEIFESVAGTSLSELDYQLTKQPRSITKSEIDFFEEEDQRLRILAEKKSDKHDVALREPQKELLHRIKSRFDESLIKC